MSRLAYRQCGQPITFDDKRVSQWTGKKIPLDVDTEEPHDCPVRRDKPQPQSQLKQGLPQQQQRRLTIDPMPILSFNSLFLCANDHLDLCHTSIYT